MAGRPCASAGGWPGALAGMFCQLLLRLVHAGHNHDRCLYSVQAIAQLWICGKHEMLLLVLRTVWPCLKTQMHSCCHLQPASATCHAFMSLMSVLHHHNKVVLHGTLGCHPQIRPYMDRSSGRWRPGSAASCRAWGAPSPASPPAGMTRQSSCCARQTTPSAW